MGVPPFILIFGILFTYFDSSVSETDICKYKTCAECISSENICVWCSEDGIEERCQPISFLNEKKWCKKELIENPPYELDDIKSEPTFGMKLDNNTVQFLPHTMTITTRPGRPIEFTMSYKPDKDYPLDVYYLMDTSDTMTTHVQALKKQAKQIHTELTKLTNNVQLGAGSFIEKQAFPYFDKNRGQHSHAYKNLVSLTDNMPEFISAIDTVQFGSNQDNQEAGLEALMQVMTCGDKFGWRNVSRKIIVLCTDSLYHSAGDGKMLGIIKPNDMQCHYKNNTYTMETQQDYPSVGQINKIAADKGFIIIFAVVGFEVPYTALANQITGASYASLIGDSSVVDIIINKYKDQINGVYLQSFNMPEFVELTFDPDCRKHGTENCGVSLSNPIAYINATLTVKECSKQPSHHFQIGPIGLPDKLNIKLDVNCNCKCENENKVLSPKCHDSGFYQCGLCNCMESSYGTDCQCNGTSTDNHDIEKCKAKNDTRVCSGRSICMCGICEKCPKGFSGDFCEFDDTACPRVNKRLCSDNGQCRLGKCHCKSGWTGDDCNCPISTSSCIAPRSKDVCSGNGECNCGVCTCKNANANETYSGLFCDTCEECAEKRCKELEDYVYCNYQYNKTYCDDQYNVTDVLSVEIVNKTEINGPNWYKANWCKKQLEGESFLVFKYQYKENQLAVAIQDEPELPPKANIWIPVGSAIGAVVLIGLLTVLIWKILIDIHDTREYNKFKDEAAAAGYDVSHNPIFTPPCADYMNPTFNPND